MTATETSGGSLDVLRSFMAQMRGEVLAFQASSGLSTRLLVDWTIT